jgi:hypothetical protein
MGGTAYWSGCWDCEDELLSAEKLVIEGFLM